MIGKLSGEFNRGYTRGIQDVSKIVDYIQADLKHHHRSLNSKLTNELLKVILDNREKIREDPAMENGFIRFNGVSKTFEYYKYKTDSCNKGDVE